MESKRFDREQWGKSGAGRRACKALGRVARVISAWRRVRGSGGGEAQDKEGLVSTVLSQRKACTKVQRWKGGQEIGQQRESKRFLVREGHDQI